jgi:phage-related baseplate assembly protein
MTRFTAETLDLSRLPPADLVRPLDYEAIVAARVADLKDRLEAADIPFDVDRLETDPGVILQEADAYRELLALQAINDVGRANMLAYATGADLDNLAAVYGGGISRLLVSAGPPPVYETDERFRRRILLAPERGTLPAALAPRPDAPRS